MNNGFNIYLFAREYEEEKLPVNSSFKEKAKVFVLPDSKNSNNDENTRFISDMTKKNEITILIVQAYALKNIPKIKELNKNLKVVYCNHGMPFWELRDKIQRKKLKVNESLGKRIEYYLFDIHKTYTFNLYEKRFKQEYKKMYDSVDAYVTLCNGYSKVIKNKLKLKNTEKLFAINNAEKPVKNIVMDKKKTVVFVGRLSYADKRVDRLIKGKDSEGWTLKIVGEGPEKDNLEKLVRQFNIKNIKFEGFSNNQKNIMMKLQYCA